MRFTNLQAIRLYAAASVVVYHAGLLATGWGAETDLARWCAWVGPHGVVLFFVLSGVVLAHSAQSRAPGPFLLSRSLRLYPAYWLAAALALPLMHVVVNGWYWWWGVRRAVTLLPLGLAPAAYPINGLEWTLIYEVVFSVAVAGLVVVVGRRGLLWACVAWLAVVLGWFAWRGGASRNVLPRWWEALVALEVAPFLLGVVAYFVRDWAARRRRWLPAAAVGLLASSHLALPGDGPFLAQSAGCAVLILYALVAGQLSPGSLLVRNGDRTYGLYLLHVPLLFTLFRAWPQLSLPGWADNVALVGITALALAAGLAYGEGEVRLNRWLQSRLMPSPEKTAQAPQPSRAARQAA